MTREEMARLIAEGLIEPGLKAATTPCPALPLETIRHLASVNGKAGEPMIYCG